MNVYPDAPLEMIEQTSINKMPSPHCQAGIVITVYKHNDERLSSAYIHREMLVTYEELLEITGSL